MDTRRYGEEYNNLCCGNDCKNCSSKKSEINEKKGYINIFDVGGFLQSNSGIYDEEVKAIETGKMSLGYIATVFVSFPFKEKF